METAKTATTVSALVAFDGEQEPLALVDGFLARTLPHASWTHRAHLVVGLWHVLNRPADRQLEELRRGISAYNESVGTANTDSGGYHETITAFYLWAIRRLQSGEPKPAPFLGRANRLLTSPCASRDFPFRYYSRDRLLSVAARRSWIAPDLMPLD